MRVRDQGICGAVLDPRALSLSRVMPQQARVPRAWITAEGGVSGGGGVHHKRRP